MEMDRRREAGALVRKWRVNKDPVEVPGVADLPHRSGRQGHLTQEDMAFLVGASDRWYRSLEQGTAERVGEQILAGVAYFLDLDETQRAALYTAYGQQPPLPPPQPLAPDDPLRIMLHAQPHPAYISVVSGDIVEANEQAQHLFPWSQRPGANVMLWLLSSAAQEMMPEWLERWARPTVAQLRIAATQHPDNERLQQVARDVRAYEPIDRLWRTDSLALVHTYGSVRPMHLPTHDPDAGPVPIRLVSLCPLADPNVQFMLLVHDPDAEIGPPAQ